MKLTESRRNLMLVRKKIKGRRLFPDVSNCPYDCMVSQPGRPQSEWIKEFVVDQTTRHSFGKGPETACYGFRGRIQVLLGLKLIRFWVTCLKKRVQNYAYKIT